MDNTDADILNLCRIFTMTSNERQLQTLNAVEKIVKDNLPGDFIEIGVWRGV